MRRHRGTETDGAGATTRGACLLLAMGAVLIAALTILVVERATRPPGPTMPELRSYLPVVPDWRLSEERLADSAEMERAIAGGLQFDDAICVKYMRGAHRVSVYMAYWGPDKVPHRLVASHTPDVCWPHAGWTRVEEETREIRFEIAQDIALQRRVFRFGPHEEHLVFCHIVGDQVSAYSTRGLPPWHAVFTDVARLGYRQRAEQLFLRISSNEPFETNFPAPIAAIIDRIRPLVKGSSANHPGNR